MPRPVSMVLRSWSLIADTEYMITLLSAPVIDHSRLPGPLAGRRGRAAVLFPLTGISFDPTITPQGQGMDFTWAAQHDGGRNDGQGKRGWVGSSLGAVCM